MGETHGRRRFVAVVAIASALLVLTWLVAAFDTSGSSDPVSVSSALVLAVPVVVLLVIAGLTWFLLKRDGDADAGSDADSYVECASCGRSILREWRLCPYCGARTRPVPRAGEAAHLVP